MSTVETILITCVPFAALILFGMGFMIISNNKNSTRNDIFNAKVLDVLQNIATIKEEFVEFQNSFTEHKNNFNELRCNVLEIQGTVQELSLEPNVSKSLNKVYELEIQAVNDVILIDFLSARTKNVCDALNSALASRPKTLKEVKQIKDFHSRRIIKNAGRMVCPEFEKLIKNDVELIQFSTHLCLDLVSVFSDIKYNSHIERAIKVTKKYLSETIRHIIIKYEKYKQKKGYATNLDNKEHIDINKIRTLIGDNEIDKALLLLPNTNEFALLKKQYSENKNEFLLQTKDSEESKINGNKILNSILEIYERMNAQKV